MKAILVIDVPTESLENVIASVNICEQREGYNIILKRMGKQMLKPLPKKKEIRNAIQYRGLAEEYRKEGWNACLEEITGETDESMVKK